MLEVVGCVLEAWFASKGLAVGPSASASGIPRETREQRLARSSSSSASESKHKNLSAFSHENGLTRLSR